MSWVETAVGFTNNRLTILSIIDSKKCYAVCSCGTFIKVDPYKIRSGHTKSCGCKHRENKIRHGMHNSKEYGVWEEVKQRCKNPNNKKYPLYGGRGIKLDEKWEKFEGFFEDMGVRLEGRMSLERLNSNGNYCKENCIWADYKTQARNTSQNHYLTYKGETKIITAWAEERGWHPSVIFSRINYGWSVEEILSLPKGKRRPNGTRNVC